MEGLLILARALQFASALVIWGMVLLDAGPTLRWLRPLAVANLAAAVLWFLAEAGIAADGAPTPSVWLLLVRATPFGKLWLLHLVVAAALVVRPGRVLAGVNLATLALTGHAVLPGGGWGVAHQMLSVAHLLAAGFWLGGLVAILPLLNRPDGASALRAFSFWGHLAVAMVVGTGLLKGLLILGQTPPSPVYLALLTAKVALVLGMIGLALRNRYVHVPRLRGPEASQASADLRYGTLAELVLMAGILGLVSIFATLSPHA